MLSKRLLSLSQRKDSISTWVCSDAKEVAGGDLMAFFKTLPRVLLSRFESSPFLSIILALILAVCLFTACEGDYEPPSTIFSEWQGFGGNANNTSQAVDEKAISASNVRERGLQVKWVYDTTDANGCNGTLSHPPTIFSGHAYFTTARCGKDPAIASGYLHAVNAATGEPIWKRSIPSYADGVDEAEFERARVAPVVQGDVLVIGTHTTRALSVNPYARDAAGKLVNTMPELGAYILAIDRHTGDLVWATEIESHPYAVVTRTLTVVRGTIYAGTSGGEYFALVRFGDKSQNTECCTQRGSIVALDLATGSILWKTYMTPVKEQDKDKVPLNIDAGFYTGASIWSGQPVVDSERNLVYVTTGNNSGAPREAMLCERKRRSINEPKVYGPDALPAEFSRFDQDFSLSTEEENELTNLLAVRSAEIGQGVVCGAINGEDETDMVRLNDAYTPTVNAKGEKTFGNYPDAIVALHTTDKPDIGVVSGDLAWAFRSVEYDNYRGSGCVLLPGSCPFPWGDDSDMSNGPMLVTTPSGRDLLIASNKEQRIYAIDPDNGVEVWSTRINSIKGWPDWKPATDGQRVYATAINGGVQVPAGSINHPLLPSFNNAFDFSDDPDFVDFPRGHVQFLCQNGRDEKRSSCRPAAGTPAAILQNGTVGAYRVAMDIETGNILWEAAVDVSGVFIDENGDGITDNTAVSYSTGGLTIANGVLFGGTGDAAGTVQARDAASGELIWSYTGLGAPVFTHPAVAGGVVYWGGGYNRVADHIENPDGDKLIAFELAPLQ